MSALYSYLTRESIAPAILLGLLLVADVACVIIFVVDAWGGGPRTLT